MKSAILGLLLTTLTSYFAFADINSRVQVIVQNDKPYYIEKKFVSSLVYEYGRPRHLRYLNAKINAVLDQYGLGCSAAFRLENTSADRTINMSQFGAATTCKVSLSIIADVTFTDKSDRSADLNGTLIVLQQDPSGNYTPLISLNLFND